MQSDHMALTRLARYCAHETGKLSYGRRLMKGKLLGWAGLGVGHLVGRFSGAVAGVVRRVEMLWFGQAQSGSWLEGRWQPPSSWESWRSQDPSRTEEE